MLARRSAFAFLVATTALVPFAPAFAQAAAQPDGPAEDAAIRGNEIIVTAQKIEQRAVDVPITISALTGERISELGVTDLDELSN